MLKFRSEKIFAAEAEALAARFVHRVNQSLPFGWKFSLSPAPRREAPTYDAGLEHFVAGRWVDVEGEGRLECLDPAHTLEDQAQAWQRRFRDEMQRFINDPAPIVFLLTDDRDQGIFFDRYADRGLDVADLEGADPMTVADVLVHAFEEGLQRSRSGRYDYNAHHGGALVAESWLMGGTRLQSEERSRPAGINPAAAPPDAAFEYWIPYQMPAGTVRAMVLRMRGRHVVESRLAEFTSLDAFRSAASGLSVWWPEVPR